MLHISQEQTNGQPSTPPDQSQDHEAGPPAGSAGNAGSQQDPEQAKKRPGEGQEAVKRKHQPPSREELAIKWLESYDGIDNWIARAKTLLDSGELPAKQEFECHLMMLKLMLGTKTEAEKAAEQAGELADDEVAQQLEQWYQNRRQQELAEQREKRQAKQRAEDDGLKI